MSRFFRIFFSSCIIVFILYAILSIRPYRVDGDSMFPHLKPEQISIIDRLSTKFLPLQQGEIIVYHDQGGIRIKRLIGTPGETLEISNGMVYKLIDNAQIPLEERYLEEHMRTCVPGACTEAEKHVYSVPENHYFVLGDNRTSSRDSRGCTDIADCRGKQPHYIPSEEIVGRVIFSW